MNKKLMKLTMSLLVILTVTVPLIGSAQACGVSRWRCRKPVTKEPVTLSRTMTPGDPYYGYVDFFGDSRNIGSFYIAWPLESTIWIGTVTFDNGTTIEFDSKTYSYIVANLDTLKGRIFTRWILSNDDGKFKGTLFLKATYLSTIDYSPYGHDLISPNPSTSTSTEYYAVLYGYGAYAGQKIVLSGTGPYSGPYEGFLIG